MNSKWQMHKIGLIDFWYYDEEEFHFLDGRMLLRGANGSGKSVTMQSFIPLLLDGNMRPERLDPFGSRARKMENYLLEEGSEQEERTGYLYMEFKRQDNENYLTIGIGMRARKNKKLDTWYFTITDGRRIGKDMFLYKDLESKIAYTRLELRNRIGEGGKVMESQSEYVDCVNRLLFGFETIEEYKEMLELLIQLRTPKLSKDFKPTVINDILSSSLQTLSEDDLRPMSEAIENMDNLKTNLDTLKDSVAGGKSIERVYDSYNQIVLYNKANYYREAIREYKECEKTEKECFQKIIEGEENVEKERQCYEALNQE
ncbi:MAG: TIGR02680 family protein, partial [Lachnospiraceae bacterium]